VGASLTYHENFDATYPWNPQDTVSGWPTPAVVLSWFVK
jgi:hypothetical protein